MNEIIIFEVLPYYRRRAIKIDDMVEIITEYRDSQKDVWECDTDVLITRESYNIIKRLFEEPSDDESNNR